MKLGARTVHLVDFDGAQQTAPAEEGPPGLSGSAHYLRNTNESTFTKSCD